jgi:hypothetical protein
VWPSTKKNKMIANIRPLVSQHVDNFCPKLVFVDLNGSEFILELFILYELKRYRNISYFFILLAIFLPGTFVSCFIFHPVIYIFFE